MDKYAPPTSTPKTIPPEYTRCQPPVHKSPPLIFAFEAGGNAALGSGQAGAG